ncbi:hypothetical protein MY11210_008880 [Beauveria gryllotalpidicola]
MPFPDLTRLRTHDLELGVTHAIERRVSRHVVPAKRASQRRLDFERARPRWLRECLAEATGVFFYVFPGIAAAASFTLNLSNPAGTAAYGSLFQTGWAFGLGIAFAIICCAPTSGGHFNPSITLALCLWHGFPLKKVPQYIISQIFGAFIAGLLVMGMYWPQIQEMKQEFIAAGKPLVANGAPASILCAFPNPNQTNHGFLFMTEFFVNAFLALVIWACIDPTNPFISPASAPFVIGTAYSTMIWAFADITISTNTARDLGARMVAAIFFGNEAFTYMTYSPISILVGIPATLCATGYYEFLMRDSVLRIQKGHVQFESGSAEPTRHLSRASGTAGNDSDTSKHTEHSNQN